MRLVVSLLVVGTMVSGCAWFGGGRNSAAKDTTTATNSAEQHTKLIVTPDLSPVGTVRRVNTDGHFVVVNYPFGSLPQVGQRLFVYRHGLKVGELKVSKPQLEDSTVADIVNGEAQVGDEIRSN